MLRVLIFISGQIFQGKSNMFKNKINPMKKKITGAPEKGRNFHADM